ncbi:phage holin family protein [bacterium]|nr:phage holin family protein [bacterium]
MIADKGRKLILQIIAGTVGIWLAKEFIEGVIFTGSLQDLLIIGVALGLINFFIKPILDLITLPLRILTLGLFGFLINTGIVWTIDILFKELNIVGLFPLLWTTLIVWIISIIASRL